ncbi:hypothetical protein GCM10022291_16330 [Postechiella marina]|uniref:STAS/SEC14 domain-containing protein n=1 Tax=Postechiella marina TaxID=943941 RepID=A0ABP8C7M6_9FLAO
MISSTFKPKLNILQTEFKNVVTSQEVLEYLKSFKDNTTYPRQLRTIVDATNASFSFSYKSLKQFNSARIESLKNYNIVVTAVVISNPATAAISTLYGAIARGKKYKYKVFSTRSAALKWIESYTF